VSTRFAKHGDAHIAYRTFGEGPRDILLFLGEYIPVDAIDEEPRYARCLNRLTGSGRVVAFNPRGVGLSDPMPEPSSDGQADDARAVLDAVGAQGAIVFGANVGGPAAIRFASRYPDRTTALVLANSYARLVADVGYEGLPAQAVSTAAEQTTATDEGTAAAFDFLTAFAPSVADDARFRSWWDQAGHRGASPANSRALWNMLLRTDVRDDLPGLAVPTLVLHRSDLAAAPPNLGRYIAAHVDGARYVELPGADLMWWVGDSDAMLDQIEMFIGTVAGSARPRRRLATVMFVDVVGSTERAVAMGDRRWRSLLDTYHEVARRSVDQWEGVEVGTAGDGLLATFAMPADAIGCARAIAEAVHALGLEVRAGVHTGEIEVVGDDIAGIGVHIAARVMDAATPGEVLVSRTVTDLVAGSGLVFVDRGVHTLKGVPGEWQLFAVTP